MAEYFRILTRECRKRFEDGMTAGRAASEIPFGRFNDWIGAERNLLNTFRLYCELDGTLTPFLDVERMRVAADEYNAIQEAAGSSVRATWPGGVAHLRDAADTS